MKASEFYPVVVFDGSCGFCRNILNFLRDRYDFPGVNFLPYSNENAELWNFPPEIIERHNTYMYYMTSSTEFHRGYFAFQQLFAVNKDLKNLSHWMRFRVFKIFGTMIYILISRNRRRLSGRNSSCGI